MKLKLAEEGLAQRERVNEELRDQVAAQLQIMTQQEERLHQLEMERRRLHNLVQELKVTGGSHCPAAWGGRWRGSVLETGRRWDWEGQLVGAGDRALPALH